jgi:hypothetical protein
VFFHLPIFIYSLIFALGLEISIFESNFSLIASAVPLLFSIWGIRKSSLNLVRIVSPVIFALSALNLLYLIDSIFEKQVFIVLAAALYYLGGLGNYRLKQYEKDQTARSMIAAATFSALFFFFAGTYGIYLNFAIPLWTLMLFYLVVIFLESLQYFVIISPLKRLAIIYSLILSLVFAEITWVINFWPFGHLTTGVIMLMLYYILWDLVQSYFLNILSKKRVIIHVIFFTVLILMVLLTSKWLPTI